MVRVHELKRAQYQTVDYNPETDTVIKSFTEPGLFIYSKPGYHSNLIDGKFVQGGSSFKKHFTEEFDQEARAFGLAKHWGITGEEILRLWKAKGTSTNTFGSAFHKILELDNNRERWDAKQLIESINLTRRMYMANLEIGEKVFQASKSAEENYAKPTHLDIRALMKATDEEIAQYAKKVVSEFHDMKKKIGYHSEATLAEVYVTYAKYNMGGEIDMLLIKDWKNKICRVQDH